MIKTKGISKRDGCRRSCAQKKIGQKKKTMRKIRFRPSLKDKKLIKHTKLIIIGSNPGPFNNKPRLLPTVTEEFFVFCMQIYYVSTYTPRKPKNYAPINHRLISEFLLTRQARIDRPTRAQRSFEHGPKPLTNFPLKRVFLSKSEKQFSAKTRK